MRAVTMTTTSYTEIRQRDSEEHKACPFKWDCGNCYKPLCLRIVAVANFPSKYGRFKVLAFTNNKDEKDHIMVVKGDVVNGKSLLTRVHSSCVTGDVLGSLRCDCGEQVRDALSMIEEEGRGALLYMQQEGRGIGLINKIKAYMIQDEGFDTYDANIYLGLEPDERQYELAAAMLKKLNVSSIRLLTNNPQKMKELEKFGMKIERRVPLEIPPSEFNRSYLQTKKKRFGHLLSSI
jgi:GTP cyclohydrolase II